MTVTFSDGYQILSQSERSSSTIQQLIDYDHQQMWLICTLFGNLGETRKGRDRLMDRWKFLFGMCSGTLNEIAR